MRLFSVATLGVVLLGSISVARLMETNLLALKFAKLLSSSQGTCRVHASLCVPVGTRPDAQPLAELLGRLPTAREFSANGEALALATAGNSGEAERLWKRSQGAVAKINLGRLYWSTGRDADALGTWREAGSIIWLALLLDKLALDAPPAESRNLLVSFVSDELQGTYDEHVLAGLVTLRLGHYRESFSHFQQALTFRPGDRRVLFRLAQAYGGSPRDQLTRADHAAAAVQMAAALRFDPDYADLHLLVSLSACLGNGDYATAARAAETARSLGYGDLPVDLSEALARKCAH